MNAARRTENTTVQLRLKMTTKTTEELRQIVLERDPADSRRFRHDAAARKAATVVLRVRNETCACTVACMFRDGVCQGCGLPAPAV